MKERYIIITVKRADLLTAAQQFNGDFVTVGIERDPVTGDRIRWADNGETGKAQQVKHINK